MKDRIARLIKDQALTSQKFAEVMGVQPSNISHILSGRNMPSFDFIRKLLQTYPELNPDWLIMGKGEMYRTFGEAEISPEESLAIPVGKPIVHELDFSEEPAEASNAEASVDEGADGVLPEPTTSLSAERSLPPSAAETETASAIPSEEKESSSASLVSSPRRIDRVLFFYDDHSFEEYHPAEKRRQHDLQK